MAILKVARLGHPVLRNKAADVEIADIKAGAHAHVHNIKTKRW